jgi:hypothetical protein
VVVAAGVGALLLVQAARRRGRAKRQASFCMIYFFNDNWLGQNRTWGGIKNTKKCLVKCYILRTDITPKRWIMEVEFRPTAEDYRGFYRYSAFRRYLGWKVAATGLLSIGIGLDIRHSPMVFDPLPAVVLGVILFPIITIVPYIIAIIKSKKPLKRLEKNDLRLRIELTGDGFLVQPVFAETEPEKEKKFWRWQWVKFAGGSSKYIFIVLVQGVVYVIPKTAFHSTEEAERFVFILEAGVETVFGSKPKRAKSLYLWGLLGLIPNVGAVAGLVLLIKGIFQFKDKILILIGASGILFTIAFWWVITAVIFKSDIFKGGFFDGNIFKAAQTKIIRGDLNTIFRYVEFYKIQHGVYPDSLEQLPLTRDNIWTFDQAPRHGTNHEIPTFFYRKVGEKYWLFSVGPDGKPFTVDDIYPVMDPSDSTKFGLLKKFVN